MTNNDFLILVCVNSKYKSYHEILKWESEALCQI